VVRIAPVDFLAVDVALAQDALGLFIETVALPGFRCKHTHVFQDAHRRNAVHDDLAGLATRTEGDEVVALAGRHVGLGCGQQILLTEVATFHHVL